MHTVNAQHGVTVSFEKQGQGRPLVLVHGGFSDHQTNWEFVLPHLAGDFTVFTVARRGRGMTTATEGHSIEDESLDVAAVIREIGEPVSLLGHSYGAHVALRAASILPSHVRKLVLYEPPWPALMGGGIPEPMARSAATGDWDSFSFWFFRNLLSVPEEELNALRATNHWAPILADAPATLRDLRALARYDFDPDRFAGLDLPVLLQIGTESPRHIYVTDALSAVLPNARIESLRGQAHEGMTTAPEAYAGSVLAFLGDKAREARA